MVTGRGIIRTDGMAVDTMPTIDRGEASYGPGCYPPPRPYYRPVPVAVAPVVPAYPVYPPPARQGFSYFSPGFSLSISR